MKLLLEKDILSKGSSLLMGLYLDDEISEDMKEKDSKMGYVVNINISKEGLLNSKDLVRELKEIINEYFVSDCTEKKALYVPSKREVCAHLEFGVAYAVYDNKYKNDILDEGYEVDNGEIIKSLILIKSSESINSFNVTISFKSLFLVNEYCEINTLWEIENKEIEVMIHDKILKIINR